ncbi:MAG: hypothetical protein IJR80_07840 [Treponema sp.]|nr:hypothetical protein [Treponema sp.]
MKQEHSSRDFHILLTETIHNAIEKKLDAPILLSMSMSHNTLLKSLLKKEENYTKEKISQNVLNGFIEDFNKNVSDINNKERSYDTTLSISMGFTFYDDDKDYKTVFKRADEAMYFNKQEFYKGRRDRRSH